MQDDSKIYRIQQPFFPFPNGLPGPAVSPDDPDSQICIMVSRYWLPLILGALKVFQYDDIWESPSEQLKNDGQTLLRRFMSVFSCGDDMREIELHSIPSGDCQQFQWRYVGDIEWINLGNPICDGEDGVDGRSPEFQLVPFDELCQTIQYRLVGGIAWIDLGQVCNGAPGEDCDCGDPTPTQPPIEPEPEDRCQVACNIAMGLGFWLHGRYADTLGFAKAAFEAGAIVADAVSDFIDAFPIFGAIVNTVVDYLTGLGALDITALQGANNNEFREWIQCELYRIMADDTDDFTLEYFDQVKDELQAWGVALPPQGPLLTIIGQMFALFLENVPASELLRRANVYKDNTANCDLCDVDCGDDNLWCYTFDFTVDDGAFTANPGNYQSRGWSYGDDNVGGVARRRVVIERTFESSNVTQVQVTYGLVKGSIDNTSLGGFSIADQTGNLVTQSFAATANAPDGDGFVEWNGSRTMTKINVGLASSRASHSGDCWIPRVTLRGTGTNPFGEDNCEV